MVSVWEWTKRILAILVLILVGLFLIGRTRLFFSPPTEKPQSNQERRQEFSAKEWEEIQKSLTNFYIQLESSEISLWKSFKIYKQIDKLQIPLEKLKEEQFSEIIYQLLLIEIKLTDKLLDFNQKLEQGKKQWSELTNQELTDLAEIIQLGIKRNEQYKKIKLFKEDAEQKYQQAKDFFNNLGEKVEQEKAKRV